MRNSYKSACIHAMLNMLYNVSGVSQKHLDMFEALSGQGIVYDVDIPETLNINQAKSIVLEYVTQLYKQEGQL